MRSIQIRLTENQVNEIEKLIKKGIYGWVSEIKAYKERKHRMELRRQQKQTLS